MEEKLETEQKCLEKAVHVASKLYSKNTELRVGSYILDILVVLVGYGITQNN